MPQGLAGRAGGQGEVPAGTGVRGSFGRLLSRMSVQRASRCTTLIWSQAPARIRRYALWTSLFLRNQMSSTRAPLSTIMAARTPSDGDPGG